MSQIVALTSLSCGQQQSVRGCDGGITIFVSGDNLHASTVEATDF